MKIRQGFVSNSSSTSFMITNKSNEKKTLVDFVKETPHIIEEFKKAFDWYADDDQFTQKEMIKCAKIENEVFNPGQSKECIFGDEDGTVIGRVYDYMLRDEPITKSFIVKFKEFLR